MSAPRDAHYPKVCFVICPIGKRDSDERKRSDTICSAIIGPAVEPFGYQLERADKLSKSGSIIEQIVRFLATAELVIADVAGSNSNVYYELGIRQAVNKPVILIAKSEADLASDIRNIRTIFLEDELGTDNKYIKEIQNYIEDIEKNSWDDPVASIITQVQGTESRDEIQREYSRIMSRIERINGSLEELVQCTPDREILEGYRDEIKTLKSLREAGIVSVHRNREVALREFMSALDAETEEIMVVGSSLLGLLQKNPYKEIAEKLCFKIQRAEVSVKFLLTHPAVADLRAEQERRRFTDIGREIIASLGILKSWGLKPENVKLYKGTPTIFAIKTQRYMLINPYAYSATAFTSPCFIIETTLEHYSYCYDVYDTAHFNVWDMNAAEGIKDFDQTIAMLEENLEVYTQRVKAVLEQP